MVLPARARLVLVARSVPVVVLTVLLVSCAGAAEGARAPTPSPTTARRAPFPRDLAPYRGVGAWVDAFDMAPSFQTDGAPPSLDPAVVDDMADHGVTTLYLQAARADVDGPDGLLDRQLLHRWLSRAHDRGMRVVGWYLPILEEPDRDLTRLLAVRDFDEDGERFDGLTVDIEYTQGASDPAERSQRLVDLSARLRQEIGDMPMGAAVLTPVHLEVVNPAFWPGFPWAALGSSYDVWLPMAYWTLRTGDYHDARRYTVESVDRLRSNLGQPRALVAPVGGLADDMTTEQMVAYAGALRETGAIGGSLYDWNSMTPAKQSLAHRLLGGYAAPTSPPGSVPPGSSPPGSATPSPVVPTSVGP